MSKAKISDGQARSLIASFAIDTPWDEINVNVQPFIELPPEQRGRLFANFVKNNFRIVGDLKSVLTKPFNPTEFIGKGWATWKGPVNGDGLSGEEDIDSRSLALTEVELAKFIFETCLKEGETSITGEEKIRRQKEEKPEFVRFAGNVFLGLWLDYEANKKNSVLEWLHKNFGVTFMDFPGQVLRDPNGRRSILCFDRDGDGGWVWGCGWLDRQWDAGYPSAGCASQS
jgi:hypothetical protein